MSTPNADPQAADRKQFLSLVKVIHNYTTQLPATFAQAKDGDTINKAFTAAARETQWETFNSRMDAVFAEDCRNGKGRLHLLRAGKKGMDHVNTYFSSINLQDNGLMLDLMVIKLERLAAELKYLV